jgi:hypothetical protein
MLSVRWKWALPGAAVLVTACLMILAKRQNAIFWATHPGVSDTPWEFQPPARFFEQLLNGPGFYFPIRFGTTMNGDFARLVSVALFWMWIGWALDRRLRGIRSPIIRARFLRAVSYSALLGLALFFAWEFFHYLDIHHLFPSRNRWKVFLVIGLRDSALAFYAGLGWSVACSLHFGRKLIATLKSGAPAEDVAASH